MRKRAIKALKGTPLDRWGVSEATARKIYENAVKRIEAELTAAVREEREKCNKAVKILQGRMCPQGVLSGEDCENSHWVGDGTGYKECRTTENHCHFYLREPRPDDIVDGALAALLTEAP